MNEVKSVRGAVGQTANPTTFTFTPGQFFRHGLDIFYIARTSGPHYILRHSVSLQEKFVNFDTLLKEYISGSLIPISPVKQGAPIAIPTSDRVIGGLIDDMSDAARIRGRSVLRYIEELRRLNYSCLRPTPLLKLEFRRLQMRLREIDPSLEPLSLTTVYNWSRKIDKAGGDPKAAYPDFANRGAAHSSRISTIANDLLNEQFAEIRKPGGGMIIYSQIETNLKASLESKLQPSEVMQNMPSRSTIERLTKLEFGAYVIAKRNKGEKYADKQYRSHYPRDRAVRPLEVVEFDDKDTRTFVIDERTGLVGGRVFVTAAVDQYSTVPLGFSISDKYRSVISAMEAFRNSIVPNINSENSYEAEAHEFYGTPGIAIFDNALYNHAKALHTANDETVKCILAWSRPYTPTEKSCIEDFNGRMVSHLQKLPGFGGPKQSKDGLSEALSTAVLTVSKFKTNMLEWAYRDFCNSPRAEGLTPRQLWHRAMQRDRQRLPISLDHFDIAFALHHSVRLRPDGVLFVGLPYQSDELMSLRRRIGDRENVNFRYHPYRLDRIFVFDPQKKKYIIVPSAVPDYVNHLTLNQHRHVRKFARDNGKRNPSLIELFKFREELRLFVQQLLVSKRRIDRRWAAQVGPINETNINAVKKNEIVLERVSELEHKHEELGRVELELSDEHWDLPEDF